MSALSKKRWFIAIGVLLLIFIITNPSVSAFKDHLGRTTTKGLVRKNNFFILSTYNDEYTNFETEEIHYDKYIGLLGNFIKINPHQDTHNDSVELQLKPDSIAHLDSLKKKDPFAEFGGKAITSADTTDWSKYEIKPNKNGNRR